MAKSNGRMAALEVPEAPARLFLRNPYDGEPIVRNDTNEECWIELHPAASRFGREVDRRLMDENLRRRNQGPLKGVEIQNGIIKKLAMLTNAWSLAQLDGTPVDEPCTFDNCVFYYTQVEWLRDLVSNFVSDLGNFRPTPLPTSLTTPNTSSDSTA
jgi:hypothetical protein